MLAFATAVIVTTEFIVVGLLPAMARDLAHLRRRGRRVRDLVRAVVGDVRPLLTMRRARSEPRRVLAVAARSSSRSATSLRRSRRTIPIIIAVRIVQGAALPVFVSVASAAVADLAGAGPRGTCDRAPQSRRRRSRSSSPCRRASSLADPSAGATSFIALADPGAASATVIMRRRLPARWSAGGQASMRAQAANPAAAPCSMSISCCRRCSSTAMFAAYTYLAAFLETGSRLRRPQVALAHRWASALAGLIGNWVAGRVVDRGPTAIDGRRRRSS